MRLRDPKLVGGSVSCQVIRRTAMEDNAMASQRGHYAKKVEQQTAAMDAWNPHVNALMARNDEAAMREAALADTAAAEGRWLGLLHGVTVLVKDNIDTAGVETTHGSSFFTGRVPNHDATVVRRLRRAGAIISGKATLHEFAFGVRSYNPVIGQARNPYDTSRIPGGSSGGSGIAVATGMADMALGTDTGGSVRIPSAINGVSGLRRPLAGSRTTVVFRLAPRTIPSVPMARSVSDVARLFAVLAGYDDNDPLSADRVLENFLPTLDDGVAGMRIAVPRNHYFDSLDATSQRLSKARLRNSNRSGQKLPT